MKVNDISPVLYSASCFKYNCNGKYVGIRKEKTQYVYRFICLLKGKVTVFLGDERYDCVAGDMLYLTPGQSYRFEPDGEFSLYSIFFDYTNQPFLNRPNNACVFLSDFKEELCSSAADFEDAKLLNESQCFKGINSARQINIFALNENEPYYGFCATAYLYRLIAGVLQYTKEKSESAAHTVIAYINDNLDTDLTAQKLSERFSYHKNYINHIIKAATGMTLKGYLRFAKIKYAKALISEGGLALTEISAMLGYYDYSHFYKAFVAETGVAPTEFRS